jgi:NADPH2:quinone reductase
MKAIRVEQFGGPEELKLVEVADLSPGPGEVVVKIEAAGVNPVDTYVRSGLYNQTSLPYTPGKDGAGVVVKTGTGVPAELMHQRVYLSDGGSGTYAEQVRVPFYHLHPLPDHLSFQQGAAVFVAYTTAYQALFLRGRAYAGETVLIHGASGGVGLAAVQWARSYGLRVLGTAGSEEGARLVLHNGAHYVFSHKDPEYRKQIKEFTAPDGLSLIVEMLANVNLQHDLELVGQRGRVVVVGNRGNLDFNPRAAMAKEADVLGMSLLNLTGEEVARIQFATQAGLQSRFLIPRVSREFPLAEAAEAHKAVLESSTLGKFVLVP